MSSPRCQAFDFERVGLEQSPGICAQGSNQTATKHHPGRFQQCPAQVSGHQDANQTSHIFLFLGVPTNHMHGDSGEYSDQIGFYFHFFGGNISGKQNKHTTKNRSKITMQQITDMVKNLT